MTELIVAALWVAYVVWLTCDPLPAAIAGTVVGACAIWVFWYWMHTWPEHAWSDDPHAFRKLLWRKLTCRISWSKRS